MPWRSNFFHVLLKSGAALFSACLFGSYAAIKNPNFTPVS
jgi:hypothetical protein